MLGYSSAQSGWRTDAEQLVYIAQGETKRADFVTLTPEGQCIACDVMVTVSPTPFLAHDGHLQRSAAAKAMRYHTTTGGLTYDNARLLPLVHERITTGLVERPSRFFTAWWLLRPATALQPRHVPEDSASGTPAQRRHA